MKALFLDFDGVLNRHGVRAEVPKWASPWPNLWVEGKLIQRLEPIIEEHPALQIIVSSTWRRHFIPSELRTILEEHSVLVGRRFAGITPDLSNNNSRNYRGDEIEHWLDAHPYIKNYAILDDDADMLDHQKKHFVQTSMATGITPSNVDQVIKILNRKE